MPNDVRINFDISGESEAKRLAEALRVLREQLAQSDERLGSLTQESQRFGQAAEALQKILDRLGATRIEGLDIGREVDKLQRSLNGLGTAVNGLNRERLKLTVDTSQLDTVSTRFKRFERDLESAKQLVARKASPEVQSQQAFVEQLRARVTAVSCRPALCLMLAN